MLFMQKLVFSDYKLYSVFVGAYDRKNGKYEGRTDSIDSTNYYFRMVSY